MHLIIQKILEICQMYNEMHQIDTAADRCRGDLRVEVRGEDALRGGEDAFGLQARHRAGGRRHEVINRQLPADDTGGGGEDRGASGEGQCLGDGA